MFDYKDNQFNSVLFRQRQITTTGDLYCKADPKIIYANYQVTNVHLCNEKAR